MRLRDLIDSRGGFQAFFKIGPPTPTELERFASQWPAVAAQIGIKTEPQPPRLFELGEVFYQRAADGVGVGEPIMRDLADRHSRNPDVQIDGDVLKSRFVLDAAVQAFWPRPIVSTSCDVKYGERSTRAVDVVTSLVEKVTLLTLVKV